MNVKTLKYLGVTLDPGLTWIPHVNATKDRITRFNQGIRRVAKATWGLSPHILKRIYLQASERIILYAASVWYKNTTKINDKLKSIQRIPLLTLTKVYVTTSTEAVQILVGIIPIQLKVLEEIVVKRTKWGWRLNDLDYILDESLNNQINFDIPAPVHPSTYRALTWRSSPTALGWRLVLKIYTDQHTLLLCTLML